MDRFSVSNAHTFAPTTPRVLIIESSAFLSKLLHNIYASTLAAEPQTVYVRDAQQAAQAVKNHTPAVVFLDATAPGTMDLAKTIWHGCPTTKIIFWCLQHKEQVLRQIIKLAPPQAVYGYVLKTSTEDCLAHAIRSVVTYDNSYTDPSVRSNAAAVFASQSPLTDSEFETLFDIACGLTDKAIAAKRNMSVRGVQNRITIIFQKLLGPEQELGAEGLINLRVRAVLEATRRGLIDLESLPTSAESAS